MAAFKRSGNNEISRMIELQSQLKKTKRRHRKTDPLIWRQNLLMWHSEVKTLDSFWVSVVLLLPSRRGLLPLPSALSRSWRPTPSSSHERGVTIVFVFLWCVCAR